MTPNRTVPPPNPGKVLRRQLKDEGFGVAQDDFADALGVSRLTVNQLLNGRRSISPEMALRLQAVIGTTPEMWLALQAKWDLYEARERLDGKLDHLPRLIDLAGSPPA